LEVEMAQMSRIPDPSIVKAKQSMHDLVRTVCEDFVSIRGISISLSDVIEADITDKDVVRVHRDAFDEAEPFRHLVVDHLFDDDLLTLIHEEFDIDAGWRYIDTAKEETYRRSCAEDMKGAARTYINAVSSQAFLSYLSKITNIPNLIFDAGLSGGGLHESRNGGYFEIHRDFNRHPANRLQNALVMITYLNKDWDEAYGGSLELWNKDGCVKSIPPEFGKTVILSHSKHSLHGHPVPLAMPPGRTRRSIAVYYYINQSRETDLAERHTTRYLGLREQVTDIARTLVPPILWRIGVFLHRRARRGARAIAARLAPGRPWTGATLPKLDG
jgi:Rps23 Pro-64 3,4-dihydroxylase Tpa1-like proline 4-hydroxylase